MLARWGSVEGILSAPAGDLGVLEAEIERLGKEREKSKRRAAKAGISAEDKAAHDATVTHAGALIERTRETRDAEKCRGMIVEYRARVELGLALATLDPFAPLDPPFDLEACRVGGFDVPALVALYERLGFRLMAGDVAASSTAAQAANAA